MARKLRLNAFDMNTIGHMSPGLWKHPRDTSRAYNTIGYWAKLAQIAERGLFDAFFLADSLGSYDIYQGRLDAAVRDGAQTPSGDPMLVIPGMAAVTEHLSFVVTSNVSYEPPFLFARRMSTLDHLTNGRIGWNIVTGSRDSAARAMGYDAQRPHDERYLVAEDYMAVVYKLWEGSWHAGAVVNDPAAGTYVDPGKVVPISHQGDYFRVNAVHLSEPSPQRTPVLFQAGASAAGRQFAARHAEGVFIQGPSILAVKSIVRDLRGSFSEQGRNPKDIAIFAGATVIVAETDEAATEKFADYRRYVSQDGALALLSGWTGTDLSSVEPDSELQYVKGNGARTIIETMTIRDPDRKWTVREAAEYAGIGGVGPIFIGSPVTVADELERWAEEADLDGFNLTRVVSPDTLADFVDLVVPELQRRGIYKHGYDPGTFREKLSGGAGPYLPSTHPAAQFRHGGLSRTSTGPSRSGPPAAIRLP